MEHSGFHRLAGVKPRLELLANGVLTCAAGRGAYGHPQVTHVMLSLDDTGDHWEYPFAFHTGPGCSYTSTTQRDGKLHVVYSHSDFGREMGTHGLRSAEGEDSGSHGVRCARGCAVAPAGRAPAALRARLARSPLE